MINMVQNNTAQNRYELHIGKQVAITEYRREGQTVQIMHVVTPPELRGGGVAGQLMAGVVESVRAEGLNIHPICSYAVAWFKRHKEHADILKS
jgi:predicted GNAT family acetyltransferase